MKCISGIACTNEYELSTFRTENASQNRHPLKRQDRTQSGITTAAMRRSRLSTNTMAVVECLLQAKLPPRYVKQLEGNGPKDFRATIGPRDTHM